MTPITGLFNIFSLLYIFRSVQLTFNIGRQWTDVSAAPLNLHKKKLAEQAAFFIAVPPSVLIHELFHALAIWLFGGTVVEFGYKVFWGYVVPEGNFTPAQNWFIALAGTLGSLLFGLTVWLLLRNHKSRALRYFGLRAFRFQIYFSLIYYPIFSIFLPIGDWRTIYDFQATPILSGLTAVAQVGILALFWHANRIGWFEMVGFESASEEKAFERQVASPYLGSTDLEVQLSLIDTKRRGGAPNQAIYQLRQVLAEQPNSAESHLLMAAALREKQSRISEDVIKHSQEALSLGLNQPQQKAYAHQLLGQYHLDRNERTQAITHFSEAISAINYSNRPDANGLTPDGQNGQQAASLYHLRSQAYRRNQEYALAYKDAEQAIKIAQAVNDTTSLSQYQQELSIIEKHAGKSFAPHILK